ncbi:MAG: type III-A CRISPR-associated RAMP protein Csm5 [Nitrospirae bacterium]|nr:type III-A CRISPR-associated RAMP protein Csm5 [Nitrospirota bacterium]
MDIFEKRKIKIKALSPVCIKGMALGEYAYNYVRKDEYTAYSIDSDKLGGFLYERDNSLTLLNTFIDEMEQWIQGDGNTDEKNNGFSIGNFLSKKGIYDYRNNKILTEALIQKGVFKSVINAPSKEAFIRNGFGKPYIPGSSIKGALRTAVMYKLIKNYKECSGNNYVKEFMDNIESSLDKYKKITSKDVKENKKKIFSKELQNYLFQGEIKELSPDKDFFKYVNVKDTPEITINKNQKAVVACLEKSKMLPPPLKQQEATDKEKIGKIIPFGNWFKVKYINKEYDFTDKICKKHFSEIKLNVGKAVLIKKMGSDKITDFEFTDSKPEVVDDKEDGTNIKYKVGYKRSTSNNHITSPIETFTGSTTFDIIIDKDAISKLEYVPFSNINELLGLVNEFNEDLWIYEKELFNLTTNEDLFLAPTIEFYKKNIQNKFRIGWGSGLLGMTIDLLFKDDQKVLIRNIIFNKDDYGLPAPKTRRLIFDENQPTLPLGWVAYEIF